jgi:hypothetical protein
MLRNIRMFISEKMANRHRNDHLTKQMILEAAFKQELAEYKSTGVMPRMKTTTAETVNAFEAEDIPDAPEATENLELFLNGTRPCVNCT